MSAPTSADVIIPAWAFGLGTSLLLLAIGVLVSSRRAALDKIITAQEEMLRSFQALQVQQALHEQGLANLRDLIQRHEALLARVVEDQAGRTERVQGLAAQAGILSEQLTQLRELVLDLRRAINH
jgi:hypothetical protein